MLRLRLLTAALCAALGFWAVARAHEKVFEGGEEGGAVSQPEAHCDDGLARGFPCWNVDLLAWLPPGVFGYGLANDIWGWTDPKSGREIALLGLRRGTAFADVSDPHHPVHLGLPPRRAGPRPGATSRPSAATPSS